VLAGGDKAVEKDLAKYASPDQVYKSLRSLQADISSGKLKAPPAPLPANATDEQKAEYRKTNGLPEAPEGYVAKVALPDGVVLGEADKPLVGDFAKMALERGWSQDQFNQAVGWFYEAQAAQDAQRVEADGQLRVTSEVALRTEWGSDYAANMNAFGAFKAMLPQDFQELLFTARTPDGRMLGNTAELIRIGAQLAREFNPAATLIVPGGDATKSIGAEIESIEGTYRKAISGDGEAHRAYYGHDGKPGLEVRHRELIDAQQKMTARQARAA
jgi:hypothetical protein